MQFKITPKLKQENKCILTYDNILNIWYLMVAMCWWKCLYWCVFISWLLLCYDFKIIPSFFSITYSLNGVAAPSWRRHRQGTPWTSCHADKERNNHTLTPIGNSEWPINPWWTVGESGSTRREPTSTRGERATSTQKGKSNQRPSCYGMTVLTTALLYSTKKGPKCMSVTVQYTVLLTWNITWITESVTVRSASLVTSWNRRTGGFTVSWLLALKHSSVWKRQHCWDFFLCPTKACQH